MSYLSYRITFLCFSSSTDSTSSDPIIRSIQLNEPDQVLTDDAMPQSTSTFSPSFSTLSIESIDPYVVQNANDETSWINIMDNDTDVCIDADISPSLQSMDEDEEQLQSASDE